MTTPTRPTTTPTQPQSGGTSQRCISVTELLRAQRRNFVMGALGAIPGVPWTDGPVLGALFGNIALLGASEESEFPDLQITVPASTTGAVTAGGSFKLSDVVNAIRTARDGATQEEIRNLTLRQMCEPFAQEARTALFEMKKAGVVSNLAIKMRKIGGRAPQVCFDFNAGLNQNTLSNSEKSVIQQLNVRLFKTEQELSKNEAFRDGQGSADPI
uniref:CP n=1 Tax=Avocado betaflexivirus 1 TaxID=2794401 RepID=A0A7T5UG59_9VIRU|nr:CP [Avocado betaflexivirus 1]